MENDFGGTEMDQDRMLSLKQVSERLSVPASTIRWWKHKGKLPFTVFQLHNRRLRFKESDLVEYLRFAERRPARP